ncbi:MAG: hypothetical protein HGA66_04415, partial [Holophaga sp.]|nr:hypothetical protein [Holophaga sp.]
AVLSDRLRAEVTLRRIEAELAGARSALARAGESVRRLSGLETLLIGKEEKRREEAPRRIKIINE